MSSLYADPYGQEVVNFRIGNVSTKPVDKRRLSIWISPRDLAQFCGIALDHPDIRFEIFYGVSDNARSWYDNRNAEAYGYRPQDKSELYADAVLAKEALTDPTSPDETYQGGIESFELRQNPAENQFSRIPARWIRRSRGARHHAIHGVFDRIDGPNSEFSCRNGFDHRVAEYDVVGIDPGNDNVLLTRGTAGLDTSLEKALNLVMNAIDRLRAAVLIERTGDRHALADRHAG